MWVPLNAHSTVGDTKITLHDFTFGDSSPNYITLLVSSIFYITRFGLCRVNFLDYTILLLSCNYESLTQGNHLNPNHDGSSAERDVPNDFCMRNKSLSRGRKQPTFFLSVNSCKHDRRRRSDRARCSQGERYVQGWFLLVTMHFEFSDTMRKHDHL